LRLLSNLPPPRREGPHGAKVANCSATSSTTPKPPKPREGPVYRQPRTPPLSFCFSAPKAFGVEKQKNDLGHSRLELSLVQNTVIPGTIEDDVIEEMDTDDFAGLFDLAGNI